MSGHLFLRRISLMLLISAAAAALGSCSSSPQVLLLADPLFAQEIISEETVEELEKAFGGRGGFTLLEFDPGDATGVPAEQVRRAESPLTVLSPRLSNTAVSRTSSVLDEALALIESRGGEIALMLSEDQVQRASGYWYLVHNPANGWQEVDALLAEEGFLPSSVGILYDREMYGGRYELAELFPLLFSSGSQEPEVVEDRGGFTSDARIDNIMSSFEERGVEIVIAIIGSRSPYALSQLENHDMLGIIEHGAMLELHSSLLYASLEFDYPASLQQLKLAVDERSSDRRIPLARQIIRRN